MGPIPCCKWKDQKGAVNTKWTTKTSDQSFEMAPDLLKTTGHFICISEEQRDVGTMCANITVE